VVSTFKWGWLPVGPLITQRFEAGERIGQVGAPVLVVHGSEDRLIRPELGRRLYEQAAEPKRFVLVEGGSHHNTNSLGRAQYRAAMAELFGLRPAAGSD
jgi:alpha-beta hydrolase superfamily lysophospholipase